MSWRLRCEVALHRYGWLPLVLFVTLAASAAFQWAYLRPLQGQRDMLAQQLASGQPLPRPAPAPMPLSSEGVLDELSAVLASPSEMNAEMASVFDAAGRQGLRFERSSYQYEANTGLPWTRVSISVPVSGSYPAVRNLVEAVLRDHPNMSLDQLSIQKEASEKAEAEVQLTFSAWFSMPRRDASAGSGAR